MSKVFYSPILLLFLSFSSFALDLNEVEDFMNPEVLSYYEAAIFVNVSTSGPHKQRAYIFERNQNNRFEISLWDKSYWKKQGLSAQQTPAYSWLVSSGRKYPGDRFSGPTSQGIFNLADRRLAWDPTKGTLRTRLHENFYSKGMYDAVFLDLAYSSNRLSGIAFHGTTPGKYSVLGTEDSHGCIRSHQNNSQKLWDWLHRPGFRAQIPNFYKVRKKVRRSGTSYDVRTNYVRNFSPYRNSDGSIKTHEGFPVVVVFYSDSTNKTPHHLNAFQN